VTEPAELERITWCEDGQEVYVPRPGGKWLLCAVSLAVGHSARVVNRLHGVDTWYAVRDLRVKKTSVVV
jgi:hypothetical protein